MNIKLLEMLKTWTQLAKKHDSFSEYIDEMTSVKIKNNELKTKMKNWFTPASFAAHTFKSIFMSLFVIGIPVVTLHNIAELPTEKSIGVAVMLFIALTVSRFFLIIPESDKKQIYKYSEQYKDFEENIIPFVQNNELFSQIVPELKQYCIETKRGELFNQILFRSLNETVLFSDVVLIHEFLTDYFKKTVNEDNYSEIVLASNELKGSQHSINKDNPKNNIEFFTHAT